MKNKNIKIRQKKRTDVSERIYSLICASWCSSIIFLNKRYKLVSICFLALAIKSFA